MTCNRDRSCGVASRGRSEAEPERGGDSQRQTAAGNLAALWIASRKLTPLLDRKLDAHATLDRKLEARATSRGG